MGQALCFGKLELIHLQTALARGPSNLHVSTKPGYGGEASGPVGAKLLYSVLRASRNFLLKLLGRTKINNLGLPDNEWFRCIDPINVRFGSKADIGDPCSQCPFYPQ